MVQQIWSWKRVQDCDESEFQSPIKSGQKGKTLQIKWISKDRGSRLWLTGYLDVG